MERIRAINTLKEELETRGFTNIEGGGCFDIISKRKETYLIKILSNLDSFTESESRNMKIASYFLSAKPIIVATRTRKSIMKEGVLHKRFGIPALSNETFLDLTDGTAPNIISSRSGMTIELNTDKISKEMTEKGFSLDLISTYLNISRNTAKKCLHGGRFSLGLAKSLETTLGIDISKDLELSIKHNYERIEPSTRFERQVLDHVKKTNIECSLIHRSPFNFVAKGEKTTIAKASDNITLLKRDSARIKCIAEDLDMKPLLITEQTKRNEINDIPVLTIRNMRKEDFHHIIR